MKTQNFGESKLYWTCTLLEGFMTPPKALKNYRENRENGDALQDNPKWVFPSFGLENITALDFFDFDKYFVRENDEQRGFERFKGPQGQDATRYWYLFRHKESGTLIRGFSCEPDFKNPAPDEVLYVHRFTDTYCPAIRQWMAEKDLNYLRRIIRDNPELYQQEIANLPTHTYLRVLQLSLNELIEHFTFFIALPEELQLKILEFVVGRKIFLEIFREATELPLPARSMLLATQSLPSREYNLTSHTLFAAPKIEIIPEALTASSVPTSSDSSSDHAQCCCLLS